MKYELIEFTDLIKSKIMQIEVKKHNKMYH